MRVWLLWLIAPVALLAISLVLLHAQPPSVSPAQVSGLAIIMNAPGTAHTGAPGVPPSQALACLPPLPGGYSGMPYATPGMFYDEPGVAPVVANGGTPSGDILWWCANTSTGSTAWVQIVAAP